MCKIFKCILLLAYVLSAQALDCMYCNSTMSNPDPDCENKLSTSVCTGATACVYSFGHHTYNTCQYFFDEPPFYIYKNIRYILGINQVLGPTVRDSYTMRNCLYSSIKCEAATVPMQQIPDRAITSSVGGGCWTCDEFNLCNSARQLHVGVFSLLLVSFLATMF